MPTINSTTSPTQTTVAFIAGWESMAQGDDGARLMGAQYTDKSAQVVGVFGGASVRIEGSNNGTDWAVLTDPQGNDLIFTTAKIEMVSEASYFIRPVVVGGNGTTNLSVFILMKE